MSCVLFLLTATAVYAGARDVFPIRMNGHEFRIPKRNVVSDIPFWIRLTPGYYDAPDELLIKLYAEDIKKNIPAYIEKKDAYQASIIVTLKALSLERANSFRDPNYPLYRDAWMGEGKYSERKIELMENSGFYKVHNPKYDIWWSVLKIYPDSNKPVPENVDDFWVAYCRIGGSTLTQNQKLTLCSTNGFYKDNIFYNFGILEENLPLYLDLKSYLNEVLNSWEVSRKSVEL